MNSFLLHSRHYLPRASSMVIHAACEQKGSTNKGLCDVAYVHILAPP